MGIKITTTIDKTNIKNQERALRQEASRLVSMANKRLKRIEKQDLTQTPAYKNWVENGGQKFGIRGKSNEEVKQEISRMENFLKKQTSTVTGAKKYLSNVASELNINDIKDYAKLQSKLNNFFEVTSKVKEYLYNSKEVSVSIGYKKLWEEVSNYMQEVGSEIQLTEEDVLKLAQTLADKGATGYVDKTLDSFLDAF